MKTQSLLAIPLATLATSTLLPETRRISNPAICPRPRGVYDICDTEHSFIRCHGHDAILVTDCRPDPSSYCQVVDNRGRCDGVTPPDLAGEAPACEAGPPPDPSASEGPTRGRLWGG
ncbi:hypothetical protein F4859DRAFT_513706 [Xylaria cf. heliscus]|nr:hypothetical protein F4859DRAFT_513706 [Xylaria cf. heliscus]